MHTHKTPKASLSRSTAAALMNKGREEERLLERWAASDSARSMEDDDCDNSIDQFDRASFAACPGHSFDA